ncbi:hypothetical protein B0H21DRAFT_437698 [Amylocystis lapponica]|nr:hypothetical protein B0H21DRAFT_437698 [Amylocystis lapponica]
MQKLSTGKLFKMSPQGWKYDAELDDSESIQRLKHPKYYIQDELCTFLVQNQLFRVHRYCLIRESEVFRTMFELPSGEADPEGKTDDTVVTIPDVTSRQFECFLDFLYDGMHDDYRHTVPLGDWISILSVSTRFVCDKMRDRAIREIDEYKGPAIDPVAKIVLALEYNVPMWLAPSYAALCQRERPLKMAEAAKLGLGTTVRLARAREEVRKGPLAGARGPLAQRDMLTERVASSYDEKHVAKIVQAVFELPSAPVHPTGSSSTAKDDIR